MSEDGQGVVKNEAYWEAKHPRIIQMYDGRPLPDGKRFKMDVTSFVWTKDATLEKVIKDNGLRRMDIDDVVLRCQRWVVGNIRYRTDDKIGASEYFLFPVETVAMAQGDCEDGAILIASLVLCCLPTTEHWRIRVSAGIVQSAPTAPEGGHAYVTYCRPKDNEWVVIDWCYLEDSRVKINDKPRARDNKPYKTVWFSFNADSAWSHINFELSGRVSNG